MRVGVLGIGKTPHKIQHGKSLRDLAVESGRAAMADAGVEPSDIQSLYVGNVGSVGFNYENSTGLMVAHHLGVVPAGSVRVEAACGTGAWALHLGCVAILSGLYDTVMVLGVEKMNDLATVEGTSIIAQAADSKEEYFSGLTFPSGVALTARKYMQTYGLTEEDLAHTSVKNHHYGARNPFAHVELLAKANFLGAVFGAEQHFGRDVTNASCYRRYEDTVEHRDGGGTGHHEEWTTPNVFDLAPPHLAAARSAHQGSSRIASRSEAMAA